MEKKENTLSNQIRDKDIMEERIGAMSKEVNALSARSKVPFHVTGYVSETS